MMFPKNGKLHKKQFEMLDFKIFVGIVVINPLYRFLWIGRVDHANLVINVVPRSNTNFKPGDVDVYASHTLANAKTAEDYVNKALEMKTKYDHTTPSSSFVKYDIYEGEKTKLVPVVSTPSHVTEPMIPMAPITQKEDISDMSKSASEFSDYSIEHPQEYVAQTITTTYKHPALTNHYKDSKDLDSSNSDHYGSHKPISHYSHYSPSNYNFMQNSDAYDSIRHINHDNRHSIDDAMRTLNGYPSKEELIKYIERAVKKYFKELDLTNRLPSPSLHGSSSAQGEIKTYYHFPSSTTASPFDASKLYSAGIHSEYFKPSKGSHSTPLYATVKPFTIDSYAPEGVDLTFPSSKKRPKPIDLSALDVGQSWSHSSTSHGEPVVTYRKKKKPKLHLSSQTYHDINSLPYVPNRGLIYDEYSPFSTPSTSSYVDHSSGSSHYTPHKDHPVGASISFGGHSHSGKHHKHKHHHTHDHQHHHDDTKSSFVPSMQVVNGIPINNPYKFNMETLK